ncbi:hypothetical protein [Sciscionella sediminilitoris]|uniref:hypothetical protein n=1 Tax=Sciscionella sediminilitoris TaxID=1445613 RepID=UPI0004DED7EE|nr:hypothetical protein [Sciscionella sp. SE31]
MNLARRIAARINGTRVPESFGGSLEADEHVLASAGSGQRCVLVTSHGLWLPEAEGDRRIGWHRIAKASWEDPRLQVTEARAAEVVEGIEILEDLAPQRFSLESPGRVPQTVRQRVERSILERQRREVDGGGVWFVQRREPGVDGILLQVRPDPGADRAQVRSLTAGIARRLHG